MFGLLPVVKDEGQIPPPYDAAVLFMRRKGNA